MPDRAGALSSFTPLPSFPPADVSHPDQHDSAANSTPAGFTVHLAQLHLELSYPRNNAEQFTTWAHSHDPAVIAVSISHLLWEKRGAVIVQPADSDRYQSDKDHARLTLSQCRLNVS